MGAVTERNVVFYIVRIHTIQFWYLDTIHHLSPTLVNDPRIEGLNSDNMKII